MLQTLIEDHVYVVAISRHRYLDPERGFDMVAFPGMVYPMHKDRVSSNVASGLVRVPDTTVLDWWTASGRVLAVEDCHASPLVTAPNPASLRIAAGCAYDPGSAAFRLHSAINEHTQHSSAFIRWEDTNPYCSLRQYDALNDPHLVKQAVEEADVLHNHVTYFLLNNTGHVLKSHQLLVRHYHGSRRDGKTHIEPKFDMAKGAALFGARLQLCEEGRKRGAHLRWSPIPMPVDRYMKIRTDAIAKGFKPLEGKATKRRPLIVAHSPTNTSFKGTAEVHHAVLRLKSKGVHIDIHPIQGMNLRDALVHKAHADVLFDSFWLGIQGSGLEAASMGLPVIAGDVEAAALYNEHVGYTPYSFANDQDALEYVLAEMAENPAYRKQEAARVHAYTREYHDYAAVAARYERDLSQILGKNVVTGKEK